jgi:hypothetical protein
VAISGTGCASFEVAGATGGITGATSGWGSSTGAFIGAGGGGETSCGSASIALPFVGKAAEGCAEMMGLTVGSDAGGRSVEADSGVSGREVSASDAPVDAVRASALARCFSRRAALTAFL